MSKDTIDLDLSSANRSKELAESERQEAEEILVGVTDIQIEDDADLVFAAEALADIKRKKRDLENMRSEATTPLRKSLDVIYGWFREPIRFYDRCEKALKEKIAEAKVRAEERQRQAIEAAAQAAMSGSPEAAAAALSLAQSSELGEVQGLSFRQAWDFEIVDISQVPPQFLMVNEAAVKAAIRGAKGRIEIPGIRVVEKTSVASRSGGS